MKTDSNEKKIKHAMITSLLLLPFVSAEIRFTPEDGFTSCNFYNGRGDPPLCKSSDFAIKVLKTSFSLAITMRSVFETLFHPIF